MLNNIHSFSFRLRIVNINWTNIGPGAPPEWGVPLSIPPRPSRRVGQDGDRAPAASALWEMAGLDDNLAGNLFP